METEKKNGARPGVDVATLRQAASEGNTPRFWRSLDELAGTPEFRDHAENEFPHGANDKTASLDRRGGIQGTDHVWLVMMKAMRALTRYAGADIEDTGLGLSDFGVLELLLHKGPLPVNTIGPIVDLTPGSISIAVDRLFAKGLVSRVESAEDRRVRIVALTPRGKDLIVSAFRKHSGQMKRVFSELSPEELRGLEVTLKKVGKRAAALMEES